MLFGEGIRVRKGNLIGKAMRMERKLMSELLKWKDKSGRKPLLLEGARQVGKTYLLKDFGKRYFKNVAYINFQNPSVELIELFNGSIEPKRIITMLELFLNMKISPSETLLIFDEAQEVPRALTSLKYFYEDAPEYHIAAAGSLLGVFLHKGTSFPVGKVNSLKIPLKSYANPSAFKLYFVDIGLFRRLAEIPFAVISSKTAIFDEFNGLVAEQFVLQQLAKHTLYYWTGGETSEVDFVMQYGAEIIPMEVKSGTNVNAKSLKVFRETYSPKISIRFSMRNTRLDNGLQNISLFHVFLCKQILKISSEKCVK